MTRKTPDHTLTVLSKLWQQAADNSLEIAMPKIDFTRYNYKRLPATNNVRFIPHSFVTVAPTVFDDTTQAEKGIIIQIISQLKKNNAIWHFDYRSTEWAGTTKERAVSLLRKKGLLFKTELNYLHLVNPLMIRRGSLESVIAATNEELKNTEFLSKKVFKHLLPPKSTSLNHFLATK